jgi:beta-phosphoglucomutase
LFKAILFDFDGVMAETLPWHYRAWQTVMQQDSLAPDKLTLKLHEGAPAWQIGVALYRQAGVELAEDKARQIAIEKNRVFQKIHHVQAFPEILEIVKKARSVNMYTGIVTGTTMANIISVLPPEWPVKFTVIIKDGDTAKGKPWPDPYLAAITKLEISPLESIVVENAPLGIQSAKTAGAFCVALETTLPREQLTGADVIYRNHRELVDDFFNLIR